MSAPTARARDRGSIALTEVMIASLITAILVVALTTLVWSASRSLGALERTTDDSRKTTSIAQHLDRILAASAGDVECLERNNPATTAALTNCRRVTTTTGVATATSRRLCGYSQSSSGVVPSTTVAHLLMSPQLVCLEITDRGTVEVSSVDPDNTDPIVALHTAAASTDLLMSNVVISDLSVGFRFFDAAGTELVPTGSPATLTSTQRLEVRRVRLTLVVDTVSDSTTRTITIERTLETLG